MLKKTNLMAIASVVALILFLNLFSSASADNYETTTFIKVYSGDTLWSIAEDYSQGADIRQVIYEIEDLNGLEGSAIYPGQVLEVPVRTK